MTSLPPKVLIDDVWYLIIGMIMETSKGKEAVDEDGLCSYFKDLLSLSSTCKWLRHLLAPRLFGTVYLYNTAKSISSVKAIAQGNLAGLVKELRFVMSCEPGNDDPNLENVYPPDLDHVLSNLASFPQLRHLQVSFFFDELEHEIVWEYGMDDFVDDPEEAATEERETPWRGIMAASYRAIASNYDPQRCPEGATNLPLSLEIRDLPPIMVSTFADLRFHHFLSKLKSFSLSLNCLDNGAGWRFVTQPMYLGFIECMGPWFFHHLQSVETLFFDPTESGILGDCDRYSFILTFFDANMPNLRNLKLANFFICQELRDFCLRHYQTLEKITLHDCNASGHPGMQWEDLFAAITEPSFPSLKKFELVHEHGEDKAKILYFEDYWADAQQVQQAKDNIEKEPNARAFPYASLDDKYGFRRYSSEDSIRCFLDGADDRAYRKLVDMVTGNSKAFAADKADGH
ncbi:uncharacterized protein BDV14DRAFT_171260 [Aspergillus stella-maris]|uniref:uncharacterized protein n=1 Tax=Aspergillus stella-maris TaxID=1810926 RepID=UPI003CCDCBD2